MERACYGYHGGNLVTVSEFLGKAQRTYRERGVFPYCPACGEIVQVYGAHSIATVQRFDHQDAPGADPVDDCPLANRGDARFRYLVPRDWDFQAGQQLRKAFFDDENLKKAYSFCRFFCGKGNLPADLFNLLIRRADKKNIWCYTGVELWVVPYILLTLGDFRVVSEKNAREYGFHFVFDKPRGGTVDDLWLASHRCQLLKVFTGSNEHMHWPEIPCLLSEDQFLKIAGDASWISGALLRALKSAA